jgi:amino acid adenylation domain-containing protein
MAIKGAAASPRSAGASDSPPSERLIGRIPPADQHFPPVQVSIEAVAARSPDAPAVSCRGETISYGELDRLANQVARRLLRTELPAQSIVAVAMDKSPRLIVVLLGILKAGYAYLPIDPLAPVAHQARMLADASAGVLVTDNAEANDRLSGDLHVLALGSAWADIRQEADTRIDLDVPADHLAYVIFTSGSTGRPKGVAIEHRALAAYVWAIESAYPITPQDRVLQFATITFDAAAEEIFPCLVSGAHLVMVTRDIAVAPASLLRFCDLERISVAIFTTGYWNSLVHYLSGNPSDMPDALRVVVFGGEPASAACVAKWVSLADPRVRLFNAYGPTETTIVSSLHEIDTTEPIAADTTLPIGPPLPNSYYRIVDARLRPVPAGSTGELCIGGHSLARGYLAGTGGNPDRFVADPELPGWRLYRTGDRCRLGPDGTPVILGRMDEQLKVRGYLVEPGEIEARLLEIPGVAQAIVRGHRASRAGSRQTDERLTLIGYVVAHAAADLSEADVRRELATSLPAYLVPQHILVLDRLPLTAHGKLNVAALPGPRDAAPGRESDPPNGTAAGTAASEATLDAFIPKLWAEILGRSRVNLDDDFFELGGDSLRAAEMITQVQDRIAAILYIVALYEASTAGAFAAYLRRHYPNDVARSFPGEAALLISAEPSGPVVDARKLQQMDGIVARLPARAEPPQEARKNRRAIFVLSGPRHGSTLTRVLLSGHGALFSPPELELLSFNALADREAALVDRFLSYREGLVRAIMQARDCDFETALAVVDGWKKAGLDVKAVYAELQALIAPATLVDKTSSYALDPNILARAETDFEDPVYIHLVRHPCGVIDSFLRTRIDQVFFRFPHSFTTRELAELIWYRAHSNILAFLEDIPEHRKTFVRLEDFVTSPETEARRICSTLGIEFTPHMLDVYDGSADRMTDGTTEKSQMVGDPTFFTRDRIDPSVATAWQSNASIGDLWSGTADLARRLGYDVPDRRASRDGPAVKPSGLPVVRLAQNGSGVPLVLVHPIGGSVSPYLPLAKCLGAQHSVFALQAPGLEPGEQPLASIEDLAKAYLHALGPEIDLAKVVFGGWSFGGVVAVEMARQASLADAPPAGLVLLDSRVPPRERVDDQQLFRLFVQDLRGTLGDSPEGVDALLADAPEPATALGRLAQAGLGDTGPWPRDRLDRLWAVYAANFAAARGHQPTPSDVPALMVRASGSDVHVPGSDWTHLLAGNKRTERVEGDHFSFLNPPAVGRTARVVSDFVSNAL